MLKGLFGKKKEAAKPTRAPEPNAAIDEEETIVINLSGTEEPEPVTVTLELPEDMEPESPAEPKPEPSSHDEDETIIMTAATAKAGAAPSETSEPTEQPTAGWLCITSENARDRHYPVSPGRNKIGRGGGNQIMLDIGDTMISQDNHAVLVADPKTMTFHLVPGDSTNLAYVNEEPVLQPVELKDRDVLQLGVTTLVFIQYYGNYVDWG